MIRTMLCLSVLFFYGCKTNMPDSSAVQSSDGSNHSRMLSLEEGLKSLESRANKIEDAHHESIFNKGSLKQRLDLISQMTGVATGASLLESIVLQEAYFNVSPDASRPSLLTRITHLSTLAIPLNLSKREASQSGPDLVQRRASLNDFFAKFAKDFSIAKAPRSERTLALCLAWPQANIPDSECRTPVRVVDGLERFLGIVPDPDSLFDARIAALEHKVVEPTPDIYWMYLADLKLRQLEVL